MKGREECSLQAVFPSLLVFETQEARLKGRGTALLYLLYLLSCHFCCVVVLLIHVWGGSDIVVVYVHKVP